MEIERTGIVSNSWVPPWVSGEDYTDITPLTGLNASMPCLFQVHVKVKCDMLVTTKSKNIYINLLIKNGIS